MQRLLLFIGSCLKLAEGVVDDESLWVTSDLGLQVLQLQFCTSIMMYLVEKGSWPRC